MAVFDRWEALRRQTLCSGAVNDDRSGAGVTTIIARATPRCDGWREHWTILKVTKTISRFFPCKTIGVMLKFDNIGGDEIPSVPTSCGDGDAPA